MTVTSIGKLEQDVGDLLSRRRDGSVEPFDRYAADPVGFERDVLHVDLWSRQREVAEAVRDRPLVASDQSDALRAIVDALDGTVEALLIDEATATPTGVEVQ